MAKQYFYLVAFQYGVTLIPEKVFLQEYQAVKYGRKFATSHPESSKVYLYKQEITTQGVLLKVKQLEPYETSKI